MGDPDVASQLWSGFYGIEGNSWRWTAQRFVIAFPGSEDKDPHKPRFLKLNVFVPPGQIKELGPLTLTPEIDGTGLPSETFQSAGVHTYMHTVPEAALRSNIVPVTFVLDKSKPPVTREGRELGLVVNDAQLSAN